MFFEEFCKTENIELQTWLPMDILDPCAGGDEKHEMSYPYAIHSMCEPRSIKTIDIREDSRAEIKADYLTYKLDYKPNMILTNPPFNQALNIIQKALDDVEDGGWVIMLLRLNFFGSKQRKQFWDTFMPQYAFVHHKRIGFTDGSGTDSIEYMHCCWQKGVNPEYCRLKVI